MTMSSHLGKVTSVEVIRSGTLMMSSSKYNSNRLWYMRVNKAVRRFKVHQNASKNVIRTRLRALGNGVCGESEDVFAYVWDVDTSEVLHKLCPARGPAMFRGMVESYCLLVALMTA